MDSDKGNLSWKTKELLRMAVDQSAGMSRVSYVFRAVNILGHLGYSLQSLCHLEIWHFSHACCFWTYISTLPLTLLSFMNLFWYLWAILSMSCFPTISHISVCSYFESSLKSLQIQIKDFISQWYNERRLNFELFSSNSTSFRNDKNSLRSSLLLLFLFESQIPHRGDSNIMTRYTGVTTDTIVLSHKTFHAMLWWHFLPAFLCLKAQKET